MFKGSVPLDSTDANYMRDALGACLSLPLPASHHVCSLVRADVIETAHITLRDRP